MVTPSPRRIVPPSPLDAPAEELEPPPDALVAPDESSHHGPLEVATPLRVHSTVGRDRSAKQRTALPRVVATSAPRTRAKVSTTPPPAKAAATARTPRAIGSSSKQALVFGCA